MFCITYDTTYYADLQRAFDSFMRQLWELFGPVLRVRKNKRIVSHPQPHRVGKYHAPHLRPDPHPHLPRDRLQEYHSEPEIPPEGSCSRADEAQDDNRTICCTLDNETVSVVCDLWYTFDTTVPTDEPIVIVCGYL